MVYQTWRPAGAHEPRYVDPMCPLTPTHRLSRVHFDALAAGDGGPDAVTVLQSAQLSKRILQVHAVAEVARDREPGIFAAGAFDESLAALAAAHRRSQDAVAGVLLHPHVGTWAMHCLRRMHGTQPATVPLAADLGHLGAIVAAAALRAGHGCEMNVWLRDGTIMVPTFGLAQVGVHVGWGRARVGTEGHRLHIAAGGTSVTVPVDGPFPDSRWLPLHRLTSAANADAPRIEVFLDDIDPFRDVDEALFPTSRLDHLAVAGWQVLLDEAWDLLARHHRARAEAIATALRSLVPLEAGHGGWAEVSATSVEAFGAVTLTPPREALTLAATLVHEVQHAKLGGLLELVPLVAPASPREDTDLHFAPWRPDPRPLDGLFQGAYAYLGLTHFWADHRRLVDGAAARVAHFEFARWRDQVRQAVGVLQASGRLTEAGAAFVAGMRRSLRRWHGSPVPAELLALARDAAAWHWTIWRLRNVRLGPDRVAGWSDDWIASRPCRDSGRLLGTIRRSPRGMVSSPLLDLVYLRLRQPDHFRLSSALPVARAPAEGEVGASVADRLLVEGNYREAVPAYLVALEDAPDDLQLWAGLALALRHVRAPAARMLVARPEAVYAVHHEIRSRWDMVSDPLSLASWLATT